ncbi:hypothetical protein L210DRAFT_3505189 [Boletus edulis BED1]|uniref:Uncharacterized protein n=1 Tax=Boletus edulis BED1 TaxID=1328754 RepID=A0AAD4BS25_BOLED|nr:hypothetical protein L210DRAFT_3505189 [Boletus edulis BED1]
MLLVGANTDRATDPIATSLVLITGPTTTLMGAGLGHSTVLITDGLSQGDLEGLSSPIALVKDGDRVIIDDSITKALVASERRIRRAMRAYKRDSRPEATVLLHLCVPVYWLVPVCLVAVAAHTIAHIQRYPRIEVPCGITPIKASGWTVWQKSIDQDSSIRMPFIAMPQ